MIPRSNILILLPFWFLTPRLQLLLAEGRKSGKAEIINHGKLLSRDFSMVDDVDESL